VLLLPILDPPGVIDCYCFLVMLFRLVLLVCLFAFAEEVDLVLFLLTLFKGDLAGIVTGLGVLLFFD